MSSPIETIKDRLSIQDVVSSYLTLTSVGGNFKARCPFHDEKSPSFFVTPAKGIYHCFGCNRGGDIFSFVQEIEKLDFPGALKLLADRAGVSLRPVEEKVNTEEVRMLLLLEAVTTFYQKQFMEFKDAYQYLKGRGLQQEIIKSFRIGFAPPDWRATTDFLKKKGFTETEIVASGIGILGDKGVYDRFRSRIMFPISNTQGAVIAFSGRIFEPLKTTTHEEGKYVNSPETLLFHKSRVLYGYDKARLAIGKKKRVIIVEGQIDVVMSHQAGYEETVALSGTALSDEHIGLVKRFTDTIILALDTDQAGLLASTRSVMTALRHDMDVRIATATLGKDPADTLLENPHAWEDSLQNTKDFISFRLDRLEVPGNSRDAERIVERDIYPFLREIENSITRDRAFQNIATTLHVSPGTIRTHFLDWQKKNPLKETLNVKTVKEEKVYSRYETLLRRLYGIMIWKSNDEAISDVWFSELWKTTFPDRDFEIEIASYKGEASALAISAELQYDANQQISIQQIIQDIVREMKIDVVSKAFAEKAQALHKAEHEGQDTQLLLQECQKLSALLNELKNYHQREII